MKFNHYFPLEKMFLVTTWKNPLSPLGKNPSAGHDSRSERLQTKIVCREKLHWKQVSFCCSLPWLPKQGPPAVVVRTVINRLWCFKPSDVDGQNGDEKHRVHQKIWQYSHQC